MSSFLISTQSWRVTYKCTSVWCAPLTPCVSKTLFVPEKHVEEECQKAIPADRDHRSLFHNSANFIFWLHKKLEMLACCLFINWFVMLFLFQSILVAQQLASAMSGVMSGGAPGLNQPILIPFNAGGHLGGQQGLVLSLPTAANIQGLVAAAAAGGIMTLPLQNLQGKSLFYTSTGIFIEITQPQWYNHIAWYPCTYRTHVVYPVVSIQLCIICTC